MGEVQGGTFLEEPRPQGCPFHVIFPLPEVAPAPKNNSRKQSGLPSTTMEAKMSPRLLPGFQPSWCPSGCSDALEGRDPRWWQEAPSRPSCVLGEQAPCRSLHLCQAFSAAS